MTVSARRLRVLVLAFFSTFVALTAARADEALLEAGRQHAEQFREGRIDALWQQMTQEMRDALGSQDALSTLREAVQSRFGAEETILSETTQEEDGYRIYLRTAQHGDDPTPLVTQFVFDDETKIAGFFVQAVQEAAESRFLDYETKAGLRLPFDGAWHVYWGGRTPELNYHVVDPGQRFAYDFVVVEDGSSHTGEGKALEEYHCWDRPILAPAAGKVVAAVDDLPDLAIGEMDPQNPAGNHVVLDLGNDEYAFLGHMRQGSLAVEEGDQVEQGQEIGRCGNSGNTSEPHLHLHLQNTPVLGEGEGLPAFFNAYRADGKDVERGEPQRGETVEAR